MILYCPDCKLVKKLKDLNPVKTIQLPDIPNVDNQGKWIQLICENPAIYFVPYGMIEAQK